MAQPDTAQVMLVHYHEIALKGRNRLWFENKLVENIRLSLKPLGEFEVSQEWGRILISDFKLDKLENLDLIIKELSKIFGIAYFCPARLVATDLEIIKQECLKLAQTRNFKTFRVAAKRCWKQFGLTSLEINQQVAVNILKNIPSAEVSLKNFDLNFQIELSRDSTLIYLDKIPGAGGLPVGTGGKFLGLLSGGIDSPVAAYLMLKRGARVDFIHFSAYPLTDKKSEDKVAELARLVGQYENGAKLYVVGLGEIQKEIVAKCDPGYRILAYRALMMKIAASLALDNHYQALVTGESLGQVASQTIENLTVTAQNIKLPVLRPLIAWDKQEIIGLAEKIGTYQTSIQPHQDCCSLFAPKNPVTKARMTDFQKELDRLDLDRLTDVGEVKTVWL